MKPVRVVEAVVIALVLSAGIPALLAVSPIVTESNGPLVSVLVHAPLAQVRALAPGTEVVEAYDSFVIVKATADQVAALKAGGLAADPQDDGYWIGLGPVQFDVRQGEPAIPAELRDAPTDDVDVYLVHFVGPVKAEWLAELQGHGVRILHSMPTYAFLVSMDGATRDAVRSLRFVDWVGAYHPAYKIQPALVDAQGLKAVQIVTVDAKDTGEVVAALEARGLPAAAFDSPAAGILSVYSAGELGVVRARLDASLIPYVARLRVVLVVEPWEEMSLLDFNAQALLQTGLAPNAPGARRLWNNGINGTGEIVGIGDSGLDFDNNYFREDATHIQKGQPGDTTGTIGPLSIYNTTDITRRKLIRYIPMSGYRGIDPWTGGDRWAIQDSWNGGGCPSGHGTSTSGNAVGYDQVGMGSEHGMAIGAKFILEDIGTVAPTTTCPIEGDSLMYIPDSYDDYFGPAYENGTRVFSSSWGGTDNGYTTEAMMVDRFVWNHPDLAVFFSAGNGGPSLFTVSSPATAKSILSIGGAQPYSQQEIMNSQSSRGPTADGRLKPDIVTFFAGFTTSSDSDRSGTPTDDVNNGATTYFGGTSHSSPLAAGMAALVRQYFQEGYYPTGTAVPANGFSPSAALVKAIMTNGARKMTGAGSNTTENTYPNSAQGWGRLVLDDALYVNPATEGLRKLWVVDQTSGLSTGQVMDYKIKVNTSSTPLRIVLAWSDYPALPGANPALVNNLNLQVTSPTGAVYKGNVFGIYVRGESVPNSGSFDTRNPIEGVIVTAPAVGEWAIRVEAANVPTGPQGYAIAATGDLDLGYGSIRLDKAVYGESDTINITVYDSNAASVTVKILSTFETTPETVTLTRTAPGSATWTGPINTNFADPVTDGILQVNEGGTIEATYTDASPAHDAIARAAVEASPPAISNVRAEDVTNAAATIKWTTSKNANSKVYYGTNPSSLTRIAQDTGLVLSHGIQLLGLTTDTLYYYDVESATSLGLSTRDTNGGRHYTFRTGLQGEILLVIGDATFPAERVSMYRDALAKSAWPMNEWYVASSGDPPLSVLQQYKVVIWQPGLEEYPAVTDVERTLLSNYIDGGGRILVSAQDIAWGLCSGPGGAGTPSQYYSAERCQWFKSYLKSIWKVDPSTWTQNIGLAGDPISGPYTGGVTYVGHRSGGYGDEVSHLCGAGPTCVRAGAMTSYVWRDVGGSASPDYVAVKWNSTGNNGTAGVGIWGDKPSKMVAYYFEFTGINYVAGQTTNAARTDILNRTIIWLLDGRYHPAVRVASPNGGETLTTSPATISWSRSTTGGTNVATQTLYYSNNSGQSWASIGTAPAGDTSYAWDISALPNGAHYRVKVVVTDDGNPSLGGSDDSDADFTISRAGGDTEGPLIWPGSITVTPNPIVRNVLVSFRATADDTTRGNSNIVAAEMFVGPAPGADGTGLAMTAQDGAFNAPTEGVLYSATASWPAGSTCFWIHARDAANNWGPHEERCTTVVSSAGADLIPPLEAVITQASLCGGTFRDVCLTWLKAPDEGQIGGTVLYRVLRATTITGPYTQVGGDVSGSGAATYPFVDAGAGDQAPSLVYFYLIRTVDQAGNTKDSTSRAGKASLNLPVGTSLVSSPLSLADTRLATLLQTVLPSLRSAWTYDGCAGTWSTYSTARPAGQNNLKSIGATQAVYLELTAADQLTVAGLVFGSSPGTRIQLCTGWNLVSFPSFSTTIAVSSIPGATAVLDFDAAALPGQNRVMAPTEFLQAGRAYWISANAPAQWNVPGA